MRGAEPRASRLMRKSHAGFSDVPWRDRQARCSSEPICPQAGQRAQRRSKAAQPGTEPRAVRRLRASMARTHPLTAARSDWHLGWLRFVRWGGCRVESAPPSLRCRDFPWRRCRRLTPLAALPTAYPEAKVIPAMGFSGKVREKPCNELHITPPFPAACGGGSQMGSGARGSRIRRM